MTDEEMKAQIDAEVDAMPMEQAHQALASQPSGFENFANGAGNTALAASQGLIQGVGNVGNGIILTMRDIGDQLGITSPEKTAEMRNLMRGSQEATAQSAEALGHPTVGKVAQFVGEVAPMIATGGLATSAGKSLLGAGRAADIGINTAVGAAQGLTSGLAEGGLSERARSAVTGGLLGGGLSAAAGIAGKALPAIKLDADKTEAYRAAGMKGTPVSAMLSNDISDSTRKWYDGIANTLNKIPLLGIKQRLRDWHFGKADEYTKKVFSEIDNSAPDVEMQRVNVLSRLNDSIAIDTGNITKMAAGEYNILKSNAGLSLSPKASAVFQQTANLPKMSFEQLWDLRKGLDATMDSFKNDITRSVSSTELHSLGTIRKEVSNLMKEAADKHGVGKDWATMNEGYQHQIVGKELMNVWNTSTKAGGQVIDRAAFNANLHATLGHLKERGLEVPAYYKQAVKNATVISDELKKSTIREAAPGMSGNLQGIGMTALMAVGGTYLAGAASAPVAATISGITKGLGRLITTQAGAKLLASLSQGGKPSMSTPTARIAMMTAFNIAHAEDSKPGLEEQANKRQIEQEVDQMTPEQIQALLAEQQGGQQ